MDKEEKRIVRETNLILGGFLLSGAAALIYEVAWTRALSLVLGSTVYALSTMLATFMGGLALGAHLCGKHCDRRTDLLFAFGFCELGIGISGLLSIPIIYRLPALYLFVFQTFHTYATMFFVLQVLLCVLVMLVPTLLMGATFPIVSKRITRSMGELGMKVGRAYSLNTLGAVGGSLAAGFFLIPAVGIKGTAIAAASLNACVALTMIALSRRKVLRSVVMGVPLLALSAVWAGASTEPGACLVNFYTALRVPQTESYGDMVEADRRNYRQIFHEERPEGQVRAFRTYKGELILQVGGKLEGTALGDLPSSLLLAYLPLAAHPRSRSFLTVGLGAGVTLAAARKAVRDVEIAEVNPGVINAVRLHGLPGLLDGVDIIRNDARNHLMRTGKKYDIISSQPSYPTEPGVSGLFTKEFYQLAAGRLNKNGVYCQWLPGYMLREEDVHMMVKTFGSVFTHTYVWKVHGPEDIIMLGSAERFLFGPEEISRRMRRINISGYPLDCSLLMTPGEVQDIARMEDVPVNTDDRPILEFRVVGNIISGLLWAEERP
jgi:spermidine synthase